MSGYVGQYILILGSSGIGKTYLVDKIRSIPGVAKTEKMIYFDADRCPFSSRAIINEEDDSFTVSNKKGLARPYRWVWVPHLFRKFVGSLNREGILPIIVGCSHNCTQFAASAISTVVITSSISHSRWKDKCKCRVNTHPPEYEHLKGGWILKDLIYQGLAHFTIHNNFDEQLPFKLMTAISSFFIPCFDKESLYDFLGITFYDGLTEGTTK